MPGTERFAVELSLPDYKDLGLSRPEIEPRSHAMRGERSTSTPRRIKYPIK